MNKFWEGMWLFIRHGPIKVAEWCKYDALTGAYNRRHFLEEVKKELSRVKRAERNGESYVLSIIYIDLKEFGDINNLEGHPVGDKCLIKAVELLRRICLRITDLIGRVGGDEFAILLPQTSKSGATVVADRIRVAKLFSPEGRAIQLNCGVAEADSKISLEEFIGRADEEMYKTKKGSKS